MDIAWSNSPPSRPSKKIIVLKPGQGVLAGILGSHVGVYIHWIGNRSGPCFLPPCKHCEKNVPRLWKAYLPTIMRRYVQRGKTGNDPIGDWSKSTEEGIIEFSETHREFLESGELRGVKIEVWKPSGDVKQSLRIVQCGMVSDLEGLPPAFDVKAVLLRIWGVYQEITGPRLMEEQA